jgi:hypothetical protein
LQTFEKKMALLEKVTALCSATCCFRTWNVPSPSSCLSFLSTAFVLPQIFEEKMALLEKVPAMAV